MGFHVATFVATQEMATDIFTKALDHSKLQHCTRIIGLFNWDVRALYIHGGVLFVLFYDICVCTMLQVVFPH